MQMDNTSLKWQAREYIYTEKTADWYWIVTIVTFSVAIISVILNNLIFAILIIVSFFVLVLFASKRPGIVSIELNNFGITAGKIHYPYENLESFWVETKQLHQRLILKSKKALMPYIVILIEDITPETVQAFLHDHLPEVEHTEPFLEKLLIHLGF